MVAPFGHVKKWPMLCVYQMDMKIYNVSYLEVSCTKIFLLFRVLFSLLDF